MKKNIFTFIILIAVLSVSVLFGNGDIYAAETQREAFMYGSNYFHHDYDKAPISSYLVPLEEGYMRVQTDITVDEMKNDKGNDVFGIEYYDSEFNRVGDYKLIRQELPLWGGFYAYGGYYYVVTGQYNGNESDDVEVCRVTKYDAN